MAKIHVSLCSNMLLVDAHSSSSWAGAGLFGVLPDVGPTCGGYAGGHGGEYGVGTGCGGDVCPCVSFLSSLAFVHHVALAP